MNKNRKIITTIFTLILLISLTVQGGLNSSFANAVQAGSQVALWEEENGNTWFNASATSGSAIMARLNMSSADKLLEALETGEITMLQDIDLAGEDIYVENMIFDVAINGNGYAIRNGSIVFSGSDSELTLIK